MENGNPTKSLHITLESNQQRKMEIWVSLVEFMTYFTAEKVGEKRTPDAKLSLSYGNDPFSHAKARRIGTELKPI